MPDDGRNVDVLVARVEALERAVARLERRQATQTAPACVDALLDAISAYFGPSRFTAGGLLDLAADDPHSAIADAIGEVVDLNANRRSQATALGLLLARCDRVETVARSRGCSVYRLREE